MSRASEKVLCDKFIYKRKEGEEKMEMTFEERKEQAVRDLAEEAQKLADKISKYFNTFDFVIRAEALNRELDCEHRTLQQTFARFMQSRFLHMASDEYSTDGRNQNSKELAKELKSILEKRNLPMI